MTKKEITKQGESFITLLANMNKKELVAFKNIVVGVRKRLEKGIKKDKARIKRSL